MINTKDQADQIDLKILMLGVNANMRLTMRRYNLICATYSSLMEAVGDGFELLEHKDFVNVKKLSKSLIVEAGTSIFDQMQEESIECLTVEDTLYPTALKSLKDAPVLLFYKGNTNTLRQFPLWINDSYNSVNDSGILENTKSTYLGVVGSRAMTIQTGIVLQNLFAELRDYPLTIVSGLAEGVDEKAHQLGLQHNLNCIGVLGGGLANNYYYPRNTRATFEAVLDSGGLVVSEYQPDFVPTKFSFVQRNRIISALSDCLLVAQAGLNSGSCTTAHYAMKLSKPVTVISGLPFDSAYAGCHQLIKEGAVSVIDGESIMAQLNSYNQTNQKETNSTTTNPKTRITRNTILERPTKKGSQRVQKSNLQLDRPIGFTAAQHTSISQNAEEILKNLSLHPTGIDLLAQRLKIPVVTLAGELTLLELHGVIKSAGSNLWIRT